MSPEENASRLVSKVTPNHFWIDDLFVGQWVKEEVTFSNERHLAFSELSGDYAPIHSNNKFAEDKKFSGIVVHGVNLSASFSRLIGMYLPGCNCVLSRFELKLMTPVYVGQTITFNAEISRIVRPTRSVLMNLEMWRGAECVGTGSCHCTLFRRVE